MEEAHVRQKRIRGKSSDVRNTSHETESVDRVMGHIEPGDLDLLLGRDRYGEIQLQVNTDSLTVESFDHIREFLLRSALVSGRAVCGRRRVIESPCVSPVIDCLDRKIFDGKAVFTYGIKRKCVLHCPGTLLRPCDRLQLINGHEFNGVYSQFPEIRGSLGSGRKGSGPGLQSFREHGKAADMETVYDSLPSSFKKILPVGGKFIVRLIEKAACFYVLSIDLHGFNAPAAWINEESAAAEKSVTPLGRIQKSDPDGIEASEPVFIGKQDTNLAPVRFFIEDKSARFRAAKYRGYDHAVLHHGNTRHHAVRGFNL